MLKILVTDVDGDGATFGTFPVFFTSTSQTDNSSIFATFFPVSATNPSQFWTVTWSWTGIAHSMLLGPEVFFDFDDIAETDSGSYTTVLDPFPLTPVTYSVNPLPTIEMQTYDYIGSVGNDTFIFSCPAVPLGWFGYHYPYPLAFSAGGTARGYDGEDDFSGGNGNDSFFGGNGNDTLSGGVGVDALFGGDGDDHLGDSGGGGDTLDGGSGYDRASLDRSSSATALTLIFDPASGLSQPWSDGTSIVGVEQLWLTLGSANDQVTMVLGPSVTQSQYVNFGEGIDRAFIDLTGFSTGLTVSVLWSSTNTFSVLGEQGELYRADQVEVLDVRGGAGNDSLSSAEGNDTLRGNNGNDILYGGAGNDGIFGGVGNDLIDGGEGADALIGGAGNDTYVVNSSRDRVFETTTTTSGIDAGGIDTVQSVVSFNLDASSGVRFVERLTLTGTANINGTGNALANILTGNAGNNVLNGGLGNDTMIGGAGNDTYIVDSTRDRVFETTTTTSGIDAGGIDMVQSAVSFNLDASTGVRCVEQLALTGTESINGTGNALANILTGNAGNNVLNGGLGNDTMIGGAGNDTFVFNTALGAGSVDRITDFSVLDDTIRLDDAKFVGLATGNLAESAFAANLTGRATDGLDRIIYETDTGRLYFDADGSGAGARVHFATLSASLALTNADFFVF